MAGAMIVGHLVLDDGYESESESGVPDSHSEVDSDGESDSEQNQEDAVEEDFGSISADEQIRMYDHLQLMLYPDQPKRKVDASNAHLIRPVVFPTSDPSQPRTSQERQWTDEHTRPLYKIRDASTLESPSKSKSSKGPRRTLHDIYLEHRDDAEAANVRKRSVMEGSRLSPSQAYHRQPNNITATKNAKGRRSTLAEIAVFSSGRQNSEELPLAPNKESPVKEKIRKSLRIENETDYINTPQHSTYGSRNSRSVAVRNLSIAGSSLVSTQTPNPETKNKS